MSFKRHLLIALFGAAVALGGAATASAGPWQDHHPRRVEVNHRLANQNMRIDHAVREGRIAPREAANLHHQDRVIRHEERHDAAFHGSHLTRVEQARLNHQENAVSGHIYDHAH